MTYVDVISERMLTQMARQEIKDAGMRLAVNLTNGTRRTGTYLDLVVNPLNHPEFKNVQFIKFRTHRPERDLIVYLPITQIATIEWGTEDFADEKGK